VTQKAWDLSLKLKLEEEKERAADPDSLSTIEREAAASELTGSSSVLGEIDWGQLGLEPPVITRETPQELPLNSQDA
jgi:hypothetical protein